jgi:hypothetical protein
MEMSEYLLFKKIKYLEKENVYYFFALGKKFEYIIGKMDKKLNILKLKEIPFGFCKKELYLLVNSEIDILN